MYIKTVVTFGGAWDQLIMNHNQDFEDIKLALKEVTIERIQASIGESTQTQATLSSFPISIAQRMWDREMSKFGWCSSKEKLGTLGARPINMRALGFRKDRVSIEFQRNRATANRWLYTIAPIATRNGLVDIPIAVFLNREVEEFLLTRKELAGQFENVIDELKALSPLSHSTPFILLGLSVNSEPFEIIELLAEAEVESRQIIINRSIEFPAEFHQAGLGILNYFGTVLREKYPQHNAKVRIEQDGLKVRLIIDSENGDREIIEKALQEYEMVVRGEAIPESLFESKAKVLELKSELRIAQVRIEGQRDLLEYQGNEIKSLKEIIGHSLSKGKDPIYLTVSPNIQISNSNSTCIENHITNTIPEIQDQIQELLELTSDDHALQLRLLDLDESLNITADKETPEAIKGSSGFRKLKLFLEEANKNGSTVNTFFEKANDGIELLQKLARKYNSVAEWCGAPQVPSIFLGKNS